MANRMMLTLEQPEPPALLGVAGAAYQSAVATARWLNTLG
jgi:hypothetical protein